MPGVREPAGMQLPWSSVEDKAEGQGKAASMSKYVERLVSSALFCAHQLAVGDCNDALGHSQAREVTCKSYHV